jgi:TRAP-type mannitol/chloroaromatic compound transport system permease large subunit
MLKIAAVVWIMVGTVFAGSAVAAVLSVPQLAAEAMTYLPLAGVGGYIVAMPVALLLAWRLTRCAPG